MTKLKKWLQDFATDFAKPCHNVRQLSYYFSCQIIICNKTQQLITHNQLAALPLLGNAEIHPVADHDGVLVAEVVGDALGADGALGLDVRVI